MNPFIHTGKTTEDLADSFALQLISWVTEATADTFHLVLSGGKTPTILFSLLAEKYSMIVPWQKIQFWWGDERMVSPDDPVSNFGVANKCLFSQIGLSHSQIHRMKGEENPEEEAQRYSLEIKSLVPMMNGWPAFDLIMLGMGDDGHTASIFPNQMELLESDQISEVAFYPVTGQKRITLTGKVLNNAKKVAFLISGESKAQIFDDIIHESKDALLYPASHIHPNGELYWFGDEDSLRRNK
jgi:6-phosphogluconolactonase